MFAAADARRAKAPVKEHASIKHGCEPLDCSPKIVGRDMGERPIYSVADPRVPKGGAKISSEGTPF